MRTIAITGAAGFIGSHLSDAYLRRGDRVVGIDDLSTGRLKNLTEALENPAFTFVRGDVRDFGMLADVASTCDAIVHLAARIGLKVVLEDPLGTLEVNGQGTESILRYAATRKIPTLIASTSEVYGLATKFPSSESDPVSFGSPTSPRWCYAASKAYDEALAIAYSRSGTLPARVVRLFNTVGPRQSDRYGMVFPRFVRQALAGDALTVYGDGSQTRCFCHVDDVVEAIVLLADEPKAIGDVVNIGNPTEISIADLARLVVGSTGSSSTVEFQPFESAYGDGFEEIMRRVPDIQKAHALIGFVPSRDLVTIIADVVASQREALGARR
jgi:UDP-glucose 4-epimerase